MKIFTILLMFILAACQEGKEPKFSFGTLLENLQGASAQGTSLGEYLEKKHQDENISKSCTSYGFKEGTLEFANCALEIRKSLIQKEAIDNYKSSVKLKCSTQNNGNLGSETTCQ